MKLVFAALVLAAFSTSACSGSDSTGSGTGGSSGSGGSGGGGGGSGGGGGFGLASPCGDNPSASASFDIAGGGHAGDHIEFTQTQFPGIDEPGVYYKKSDVALMQVYQAPPSGTPFEPHIELYFMGDQPKTESLGTPTQGALNFDHVFVHIFLSGANGNEDYKCCNENTPQPAYSGSITVSKFGAVGERITGTFEGNFDGEVTDLGGVSGTISNGMFDVTRCADGL